jgi:hypothetical protein
MEMNFRTQQDFLDAVKFRWPRLIPLPGLRKQSWMEGLRPPWSLRSQDLSQPVGRFGVRARTLRLKMTEALCSLGESFQTRGNSLVILLTGLAQIQFRSSQGFLVLAMETPQKDFALFHQTIKTIDSFCVLKRWVHYCHLWARSICVPFRAIREGGL